jgi:c(7)-type cytochrome triheme protein
MPRRTLVGELTQSRLVAFVFASIFGGLTLVTVLNSRASGSIPNSRTDLLPAASGKQEQIQFPEGLDYSKFLHSNRNHSRLPCLLCHRRETNAPRPALPGSKNHLPCAGCHAQQFANSASPICTICHTDPQLGKLKPFPRLSSFNMKFDHARHTRMGGVGCVTCHRSSRAGVAMTIPAGLNAHVTCYQCHGPGAKSGAQENSRDISSCGVCHEPGRRVRTSETAAAFRFGFSHAKHDKSEGLTCGECHRVRAGVAQRVQVTAPQPLNHHAAPGALSCVSCHNGKKAFGGDDFSVCKRCHTKTTWHF